MEEQTILKQILGALKDHSEEVGKQFVQMNNRIDDLDSKLNARMDDLDSKLNTRMDNLESKLNARMDDLDSKLNTRMDNLESKMDTGFDQLGKKFDGMRVELTETQETTDFVQIGRAHV